MEGLRSVIKDHRKTADTIDTTLTHIKESLMELAQHTGMEFPDYEQRSKYPFNSDLNKITQFLRDVSDERNATQKRLNLWESFTDSGDAEYPYKTMENGYIIFYYPDLIHYRAEHRIVMDRQEGRRIRKEELVHHTNGVKTDNRPENLTLMAAKDHFKLHMEKSRMEKKRKKTE